MTQRVLLVAPQPFYQDRGTPIAVRLVLEALSELGHEVDILTFPMGVDLDLDGLRILRTTNPLGIRSVPIGFSFRKIFFDVLLASRLKQQLRTHRYTYIHAVEEAAFLAAMFARRAGVPVLYDMQSCLPEQLQQRAFFRIAGLDGLLWRCERWLLNNVDLIVGSTGLAAHVSAVGPKAPFYEWAFPPCLPKVPATPARLRSELGIPEGHRVVLYSGTFEPYQGLDNLVESIPAVRASAPNVVFVLVGAEGRTGDALVREAGRLGVEDAVRFVQRQNREDIGEYLALADLVVSPRAGGKNIPLKVFDYLVAGKPIVATAIPAHKAVLDETRAILVPRTAAGMSEGILRVLNDEGVAQRLTAAARAYARSHLGWDQFVKRVDGFARFMHDASVNRTDEDAEESARAA